jgi:hypothetical protein
VQRQRRRPRASPNECGSGSAAGSTAWAAFPHVQRSAAQWAEKPEYAPRGGPACPAAVAIDFISKRMGLCVALNLHHVDVPAVGKWRAMPRMQYMPAVGEWRAMPGVQYMPASTRSVGLQRRTFSIAWVGVHQRTLPRRHTHTRRPTPEGEARAALSGDAGCQHGTSRPLHLVVCSPLGGG